MKRDPLFEFRTESVEWRKISRYKFRQRDPLTLVAATRKPGMRLIRNKIRVT